MVEALIHKSPKEIARFYISCLDPNRFNMNEITPKMMKQHEAELAKQIELYVIQKCKETARNVRHKACEISNGICVEVNNSDYYSLPGHLSSSIDHNIMNIQFEDVKPDLS